MGVNRGLPHELLNNSKAESERIDSLTSERKLYQVRLQEHQNHISEIINRGDNAHNYRARDEAFFNNLNILRQLRSKVSILTDYQQPVAMPKIKRADARIVSVLEQHDPKKTEYLATIEEFLEDKKSHDSRIKSLKKWVVDLNDQIKALFIPQILYFLLTYLPPIFAIYRLLNPVNALENALKLSTKLTDALAEAEKDIEEAEIKFNKKWGDKYSEYLTMDGSEELAKLVNEENEYSQLLEKKNAMDVYIQHCKQPAIQKAYSQFNAHPNYMNLFHLCSTICSHKFDMNFKNENVSLIDNALNTLQQLYPEVQKELHEFEMATLENLSEAAVFELLQNKYDRYLQKSKDIQEKGKKAKHRMEEIAARSAHLHPTNDAKLIYDNKLEMKRLNEYLELARSELTKRRKFIEPFKEFLKNRTGENLKRLYLFTLNPSNEQIPFSDLLKKLYPAALKELETEAQTVIVNNSQEVYKLLERDLAKLIQIEKSNDPQMQAYKVVVHALRQLLGTSDWTWEHFSNLEKAIHKNPEYFRNPVLAGLFTDVIRIVSDSRLMREKIEQQQRAPVVASPELIINQPNPLPTFFQPPSRISASANAIIKDILGNINSYGIRYSNEKPTNEQKQEAIDLISSNMLNYIAMISGEDASQTISTQHLTLLREIAAVITRMNQQTNTNNLENDLEHSHNLLMQLAPEHPVRKGVEFITDLYKNKNEYMAIDTKYAKEQLRKDIQNEIRELEKTQERHQKRRNHAQLTLEQVLSIDKWSAAYTLIKMIHNYADNLRQYASDNNAEESRDIKQLETIMDRIYQCLRYERDEHLNIPGYLEQAERHIEKLGKHPVCLAANKAIEDLKETTEYTQSAELRLRLQRK